MSAGSILSSSLPAKNGAMWLRRSDATVIRCDFLRPAISRRRESSLAGLGIVTRSTSAPPALLELPHACSAPRPGSSSARRPDLGADVADLAAHLRPSGPYHAPTQERPTIWSVPVPYARRGDPEDALTTRPVGRLVHDETRQSRPPQERPGGRRDAAIHDSAESRSRGHVLFHVPSLTRSYLIHRTEKPRKSADSHSTEHGETRLGAGRSQVQILSPRCHKSPANAGFLSLRTESKKRATGSKRGPFFLR